MFYDPGTTGGILTVAENSPGPAVVYTDRSVSPSTVRIHNNGAINQLPGGFVFRTESLQILSEGRFDMSDGAMILDYNNSDFGGPGEFIREYITTGYNGGNWQGFGIRSSTAAVTPGPRLDMVTHQNCSARFRQHLLDRASTARRSWCGIHSQETAT